MTAELNCPQCGTKIEWSERWPERPFCSTRCKMMDFGSWASEGYSIPGEPVAPEALDPLAGEDESLQ